MSHVVLIAIAKKRPMPLMMNFQSTAHNRIFKSPKFLMFNAQSHNNSRRILETLIMSKQSKHIVIRPSLNLSRPINQSRLSLDPINRSGQRTI